MNLIDSTYVFEERAHSEELARKRAAVRGRRIASMLMDAEWARSEIAVALIRAESVMERGTAARKASAAASLDRMKIVHFTKCIDVAKEMRQALTEALSGWVVRDRAPMSAATEEETRMLREMVGGDDW